jgi:hypothetical protein
MANIIGAETPLVPDVDTVTLAIAAVVRSVAGIAAVTCDELTNVVGLLLPFQSTLEVEVNPLPFTVRVRAAEPIAATAGEMLPKTGTAETGACTLIVMVAALPVWMVALASVAVKVKVSDPA